MGLAVSGLGKDEQLTKAHGKYREMWESQVRDLMEQG